MHSHVGFPDRNDDPGNHTMGQRCGGMGNGRVSSLGKKPLGSCISPKDDIASVQKVEGKHLTFSLESFGYDKLLSTANCPPDSNFRSQQIINCLERYYG